MDNFERTIRARSALSAHGADNGDTRDDVVDLIADLLHLCDAEGIDFQLAVETAQAHYEVEA